jgi:hypothetical protein
MGYLQKDFKTVEKRAHASALQGNLPHAHFLVLFVGTCAHSRL